MQTIMEKCRYRYDEDGILIGCVTHNQVLVRPLMKWVPATKEAIGEEEGTEE